MKLLNISKLSYLHCGPIDLQISAKQCVGVSGASGTGKSRLLRAIADLDEHLGDIVLDGVNQVEVKAHEWRRKVALLSAETHWWFDSVGEHFENLSSEKLQSLGLPEDISDWTVTRLSSGEKQRLGLLRLLENQPDVLLLDEPTANLDKNNVKLFETFVREYSISHAACVIWVSHDHEQLKRVSEHQYLIENGGLIEYVN